jgi:hypothetical protein
MATRPSDIGRDVFDALTIGRRDPAASFDAERDLSREDFYLLTTPGRRRRQPEPPPVLEEEEPGGLGFGDYARSIMTGGASLAQSFGWLTRMIGAEQIGTAIEDLGRNAVDYWNAGLSDEAKDALSREFVRKNAETGEWEWGDATLHTVGLMGAQSLLGTAAGIGIGGAVTKGLQLGTAATMARAPAAASAGIKDVLTLFANPFGRTALQAAARAGSTQALAKLNLINRVLGAAGFGIGEGLVGGTSAAVSVENAIRSLPVEKLLANPRYAEIFNSTDESMSELERHQYATDTIAKEAASQAGWQSGLLTGLLGAPMGAYFGQILGRSGRLASTRLRSILVGAAGEAGQEFLQSGGESLISGMTLERVSGENMELFSTALNQAIAGLAAGGTLGGAIGGVDFQRPVQPKRQPDRQTALKNAAMRAATAGADREAVIGVVRASDQPLMERIATLRKLEAEANEQFVVPAPPARTEPTPLDVVTPIDEQVHRAAALSPLNDLPTPTPEQIESENYEVARVAGKDLGMRSLDFVVEYPAGSERNGLTMAAHYGRIPGVIGGDGMSLDFMLGKHPESRTVYLYHHLDAQGRFKQHKALVGMDRAEAEASLEAFYKRSGGPRGPIVELTPEQFEQWAASGQTGRPHPDAGITAERRFEGAETRAITPSGGAVGARYALVELGDLISSHTITGRANTNFPQELQPRDRSRAGLRQWIVETAERFEPALAVEGVSAGEGAPIVGPDMIVESGNGRVAVITKLYLDRSDKYRGYLEQNIEKFGLSKEQLDKLAQPILVRVRQEPMDMAARTKFAHEANRPQIATFSATEQANADARTLTNDEIALFQPTAEGSVLGLSNERFVRAFVSKLPAAERAGLMTAEGQPTRQLANRIQAAIFARAYQDDRLLTLMAEEADPDVRNIVAALTSAAPTFARARAAGALAQADVVEPLLGAVEIVRQTRARGQSVEEYLGQQGLFESIPPEVDRMARFIDKNIRSSKRMGEAFTSMAGFLESEAKRRTTGALFGEEPKLDVGLAMQAANQQMERTYGAGQAQSAMFSRPLPEFTREQLRQGFRGEAYRGREFVGQVYMVDGRAFVANVENGVVRSATEYAPSQFKRSGGYDAPGGRVDKWQIEDAAFQVREGGATYSGVGEAALNQLDMFAEAEAPPADSVLRFVRARGVRTGTFRSSVRKVQTPEEAAHVLAPLRKAAQEQMTALVTDENGKPLAVLRHTIGTPDAGPVVRGMVLGQVLNIPGAKNVWFAHNHPGGNPSQTSADHGTTIALDRLSAGTGLNVRGMITLAAGSNQATFFEPRIEREIRFDIPAGPRAATGAAEIPHIGERRFTRRLGDAQREKLTQENVNQMLAVAAPGGGSGLMLFDARLNPTGWIPMTAAEMGRLRIGSQPSAARVLREIERTNATRALIRTKDASERDAASNLMNFLAWAQVDVFDILQGGRALSREAQGLPLLGPVYRSIGRPQAPPDTPTNPVDPSLSQEAKAAELHRLGLENLAWVEPIVEEINATFGVRGPRYREDYIKSERSIIGKANRPGILAEKPWWDVEHLRDSFRFRSVVASADQVEPVFRAFLERAEASGHPVRVIKTDIDKLARPKDWGWRMLPFDLVMPNGQLAEYYITFPELADANEGVRYAGKYNGNGGLHKTFENWRYRDVNTLSEEERLAFNEDKTISKTGYDSAWEEFLGRTGQTEEAVFASARRLSAVAESFSTAKSSSISSPVSGMGNLPAGNQVPPTLSAMNAPSDTNIRAPSRSLATNAPIDASLAQHVEEVRQWLSPSLAHLAPVIRANVVASPQDLPDPTAPPDVEGAYTQDGQVWFVASNLPTQERAQAVGRHEVFGHMAIERNPKFKKQLERVEDAIRTGGLKNEVAQVRARQGLLPRSTEAREVIALIAEKGGRSPMGDVLVSTIRAIGLDLGFDMNLERRDLERLVRVAAKGLLHDARMAANFRAAMKMAEVTALEKGEPTDEEIVAAIEALYPNDAIDLTAQIRPQTDYYQRYVTETRPADIQDFGDLQLAEQLEVEGEGAVEVTQRAQQAFEQARDRVKMLESLQECLAQ